MCAAFKLVLPLMSSQRDARALRLDEYSHIVTESLLQSIVPSQFLALAEWCKSQGNTLLNASRTQARALCFCKSLPG